MNNQTSKSQQQCLRQLKKNDKWFRLLLAEHANDSIIFTEQGKVVHVNPSTLEILANPERLMPSLSEYFKGICPDDLKEVQAFINAIESGTNIISSCQFRLTGTDGQERWIWSRVFPVDPADTKYVIFSSDISEIRNKDLAQVQTEVAEKNANEKYKLLTSLLPEIIVETDLDGRLVYGNLRAIERFEYGSDFFTSNLHFLELIAKDERNKVEADIEAVSAGKTMTESEYTAITKSGQRFPITLHITQARTGDKTTGFSIVIFDISKQKSAERQALAYQENMSFLAGSALSFLELSDDDDIYIFAGKGLSQIIPRAVILVFSFDTHTNTSQIRYISGMYKYAPEIIQILGNPPESILFQAPPSFIENYLSPKKLMRIGNLHEAARSVKSVRQYRKIQELMQIKDCYFMGIARDSQLYGGIMIGTKPETDTINISLVEAFTYQAGIALHRKMIENELRKAKLIAEESDQLKSAFLANMSHEVRTPLNGILGLAQLLQNGGLSKETSEEYVDMIVESGSSLLSLIEDILDISRIEAKQLKIRSQLFDVNLLIDRLYLIFSANSLFLKKSLDLELKAVKLSAASTIHSDSDRIQQILTNLITNALKFTQSGYVQFGCELQGARLVFFVKDTGIGIPEDKLTTIFDRFVQVDSTLSRKYRGSGLGLAISKGLVTLLGGEIWCESKIGQGSSFYFSIPYRPIYKTLDDMSTQKKAFSEYHWENYTFLIVEDDSINLMVMETMLKRMHAKTVHADNGHRAVELALSNPDINLILMDMHLPGLSGLEATKIIRQQNTHIPIIAQTANAMADDKEKYLAAGCVDYISKPIDMGTLYSTIAKYLPE